MMKNVQVKLKDTFLKNLKKSAEIEQTFENPPLNSERGQIYVCDKVLEKAQKMYKNDKITKQKITRFIKDVIKIDYLPYTKDSKKLF